MEKTQVIPSSKQSSSRPKARRMLKLCYLGQESKKFNFKLRQTQNSPARGDLKNSIVYATPKGSIPIEIPAGKTPTRYNAFKKGCEAITIDKNYQSRNTAHHNQTQSINKGTSRHQPVLPSNIISFSRNKTPLATTGIGRSYRTQNRVDSRAISALDSKINTMLNIIYGNSNGMLSTKANKNSK